MTRAVRHAIARIGEHHPKLGEHLSLETLVVNRESRCRANLALELRRVEQG